MALPPILYHVFKTPLPYRPTLALQTRIQDIQRSRRKEGLEYPDILLLLEHRPTYTGGRRQNAQDLSAEENRLKGLGAEWVPTYRGGETTFHGPGQVVGYPLLDLSRTKTHIATYIVSLEKLLQNHLAAHGLKHYESNNTGLFISPTEKLGSIGVHVRQRLTMHGFAFNVTDEPLSWFNQVVACGLADVKATSLTKCLDTTKSKSLTMEGEMNRIPSEIGEVLERSTERLIASVDPEIMQLIVEMEDAAEASGPWPIAPSRFA
ncbi:hypothetical protein FRB95_011294 [Tulasnella sp. JGI-2019a]|nr:hypothetical protein FRB93_004616 [Tulasnella sp. JGI-2019a]KAG9035429.1 hypothetical protein FRB95_011294 [Tulasnella sp. JGI-2019a]